MHVSRWRVRRADPSNLPRPLIVEHSVMPASTIISAGDWPTNFPLAREDNCRRGFVTMFKIPKPKFVTLFSNNTLGMNVHVLIWPILFVTTDADSSLVSFFRRHRRARVWKNWGGWVYRSHFQVASTYADVESGVSSDLGRVEVHFLHEIASRVPCNNLWLSWRERH